MNVKKLINIFSLALIILSIVCSIFIQNYAFGRRAILIDQVLHFYDMKRWLESGKLPTTSARFEATSVIDGEFITPRVPGGIYYIFYTLFYKLGNENLSNARLINLIFYLCVLTIFLIWFYKKFGLFLTSIMTALLLCNPYIIMNITNFWNPSVTLMFSFFFFIFLFEYINNENQKIKKISASLIFPTLAIMAQGHFTVFFSMIPTLIIYLIIRFKNTKKYLPYFILSVFLSFLLYFPYLIAEIQNNFNNLHLALNLRGNLRKLPFPQVHSLLFFPTNEMSYFFGTRINSILYFWLTKPVYVYGLIFLFISILFSAFAVVRSFIFLIKKRELNDNIEKTFKEMIFIFFLFIPTTILSFIIFRSKPGTFHYLYSVFSISFVPMILFFYQLQKKLKNNSFFIYIYIYIIFALNLLSLAGELTRYYRLFEEPRSYGNLKKVAEFIKNDSEDKIIKIYNKFSGLTDSQFEDTFLVYFPEYNFKISGIHLPNFDFDYYSEDSKSELKTYEEPEIVYSIRDNIMANNWKHKMEIEKEYLYDNNAVELTNIGGYSIFRFPKVPN